MRTQTEILNMHTYGTVLHLPHSWPPAVGTPWDQVFVQAQENLEFVMYHAQRAAERAARSADIAEAAVRRHQNG